VKQVSKIEIVEFDESLYRIFEDIEMKNLPEAKEKGASTKKDAIKYDSYGTRWGDE
jgi:hypothetical protein